MTKHSDPAAGKIAGVGLIALDLLVVDKVKDPTVSSGGTCGNVLAILATLGWDAQPVARLQHDVCSELIAQDLTACGVSTKFLYLSPAAPAPAIVERLRLDSAGIPFHSFSFICPACGERLPSYQPVTLSAIREVCSELLANDVLFVDRASPGAVELATRFNAGGKIVVFEPSTSQVNYLFYKLLSVANIVKYSHERLPELQESAWPKSRKLEVQTLGRGGLRFRMMGPNGLSTWQHLQATKRDEIIDNCGAGDWATAGLIELTCKAGLTGLQSLSKQRLLRALGFAQKLGSWSCGFPGARGAMYAMSKVSLLQVLKSLAYPAVLTMPTAEEPLKSLASTKACGLCNGRAGFQKKNNQTWGAA